MEVLEINESNFQDLLEIYQEGIDTGYATFESSLPDWTSWDQSHLRFGRIAIYDGGKMLGWAALSPVSSRCVYGGVAEVSVYVSSKAQRQGIGNKLLMKLISISEENGLWTLQSGIMPANHGSIRLHEKCGFRKIGYREKVSQLDGVWTDNVLFERRSKIVGV